MEKKIKYITCTFEDEIVDFQKSNYCRTKQEDILAKKRFEEKLKKKKLSIAKIQFHILFSENNIPELILENTSSILQQVYKLGFYSYQSILDYYKLNYGEDTTFSNVEFDNIIITFKKYESNISDFQKELIKQQQLIASEELLNSIQSREDKSKDFAKLYSDKKKEKRLIEKEKKVLTKIEKEAEIERQKQIKELRKKLAEEKRKANKIKINKREVTLLRKLDLIPKKLCKCCSKELIFDKEKEFITSFKKRIFCNRTCYSVYNSDRKQERAKERRKKRLEYAKKYRLKYNRELKEKTLIRKKEQLNALPFRTCRTCSNNIQKEKAYLKVKVYLGLRFCSKDCEKQFPIKKQKEKEEQELNKLQQKKLKKEKIEQEKLFKQKLKEDKLKQKEMFIQAVKQWDNLL